MSDSRRDDWANLSDAQLLAQCEVDTYRASGPGGQKRNKTSSAVRLRHPPSGIIVIAEESRSQHENKAKAVKRLREAIYLRCREAPSSQERDGHATVLRQRIVQLLGEFDSIHLGRRDERFWPVAALVLDAIELCQGQVSEAATMLGITTGNLVKFVQSSPKLFEQVNQLRKQHGYKPLKPG